MIELENENINVMDILRDRLEGRSMIVYGSVHKITNVSLLHCRYEPDEIVITFDGRGDYSLSSMDEDLYLVSEELNS